ncbi:unnamed protein product, partial [Symbiodinium sp. KB8]
VLQKGGQIKMKLLEKEGWIWNDYYKPSETIPSCKDGNTTDCVKSGFAVAFFE